MHVHPTTTVLSTGVPQVVSRQCCAHLSQEACALAEANPDGFMALAEFALDRMQGQVRCVSSLSLSVSFRLYLILFCIVAAWHHVK